MSAYNYTKMEDKLYRKLNRSRYDHTMGVTYTCTALAMHYGIDVDQARITGLLHDCAKYISEPRMLKLCDKRDIPVTPFEREHPFLLHAKLGAYLAKKKYGVTDEEVLSAITYHTTGKPDMSVLEKLVYIADYIEPGRYEAPRLTEIRSLAFSNLDECMYEILKDSLEYLEENPDDIDQMTVLAFEYYEKLHNNKIYVRNRREEYSKWTRKQVWK